MARPRNIIKKIDTDYFENVTAIWTKPYIVGDGLLLQLWKHMPDQHQLSWETPEQRAEAKAVIKVALKAGGYPENRINEIWIEEIDKCWHEAAHELQRWKPEIDGWNRDGWANHSDNIFFSVREHLVKTCEAWRDYDWGAFSREYQRLSVYWSDGPVWIKEFQWQRLPAVSPPSETLVGLCLADVVAQFGMGKAAQNVRHGPIKFSIIDQTPWKAILKFIDVIFEEDDLPDNAAIRRSITYHAPNILQFYRTPYNSRY